MLPHLLFMAVFAPLTSIITTFFDCKAITPYNHVFLIVVIEVVFPVGKRSNLSFLLLITR